MIARVTGLLLLVSVAMGCKKAPSVDGTDKWWLLSDLGDGEDDDGGEGDDWDDDDDDGEWEAGSMFWGELFLTAEGAVEDGALGLYAADEDGLLCEVEYIVDSATAADDCAACTFAFAVVVGETDFSEGECEETGFLGRTGQTVRVGAYGGSLYVDSGDGWEASGESELEGSDWFFEMALVE